MCSIFAEAAAASASRFENTIKYKSHAIFSPVLCAQTYWFAMVYVQIPVLCFLPLACWFSVYACVCGFQMITYLGFRIQWLFLGQKPLWKKTSELSFHRPIHSYTSEHTRTANGWKISGCKFEIKTDCSIWMDWTDGWAHFVAPLITHTTKKGIDQSGRASCKLTTNRFHSNIRKIIWKCSEIVDVIASGNLCFSAVYVLHTV